MTETAEKRAEPITDHVEAAVRAYCREIVLARQRRRADRSELHPGDIGLDIEGDVQVSMGLMNRDAMGAALEAAAPDTAAERDRLRQTVIDGEKRCIELLQERDRLKAANVELVKALDDIAKGMVPADEMPSLDDADKFRHAMWTWSQKRARAALAKAKEPTP